MSRIEELNRLKKAQLVQRVVELEDANAALVLKVAALMQAPPAEAQPAPPAMTMTEAVRARAARVYVTGQRRLVVSYEGRRYQHFAEVPRGQERVAIDRLLAHVDNGGGLDRARWVRI